MDVFFWKYFQNSKENFLSLRRTFNYINMKKSLIPLTLIVSALFLFTACDSPRSLDQMLENDSDRSNIMSSIINHQPYRLEMVNGL
jgi:hypothetical protein